MLKVKHKRDERTLFYAAVREERMAVQRGKTKKADRKLANQKLMQENDLYARLQW